MKYKIKKGYTLIEVILYIALTSIIIGVISSVVTVTQQVSARNFAITEVEQSGNLIDLYLRRNIQNAVTINSPSSGASANELSLNTSTVGLNPTIFRITSSQLVIVEGANSGVPLHPSTITISNLLFENASRIGTNPSIKFSYTVTFVNTNGRNENNYSRIFYGTANLK